MSNYVPGQVPSDPAALPAFLQQELANLQRAWSSSSPSVILDTLHAAPAKTLPGMVVIADGTDWNPGSGAGAYRRNEANSAWVFLG